VNWEEARFQMQTRYSDLDPHELEWLTRVLSISGNKDTFGFYPQILHEISTGRLASYGNFSLMCASESVRKILFKGMLRFQFDFESCHPTIAFWYIKNHNLMEVPPLLEDCVLRKQEFRERIQKESGAMPRSVKESIIATMNGARLQA
jgi:hypothetical protein